MEARFLAIGYPRNLTLENALGFGDAKFPTDFEDGMNGDEPALLRHPPVGRGELASDSLLRYHYTFRYAQ